MIIFDSSGFYFNILTIFLKKIVNSNKESFKISFYFSFFYILGWSDWSSSYLFYVYSSIKSNFLIMFRDKIKAGFKKSEEVISYYFNPPKHLNIPERNLIKL